MEHSTSAVNWQAVNLPKPPGGMARDSLTHLAHGADAICFFQWRQSRAGAEKYHSAMVPQAGPDSDVFRDVTRLGATLRDLASLAGTGKRPPRAAIAFSWEAWWAVEADSHPTEGLRYKQEALDWYSAFLNLGIPVDVVPVARLLDDHDYALVVAPLLHLVDAPTAQALSRFVAGGGHLVTTYFSGIVDENDQFWPGAHPGALRDLLGVRVEEFAPLPAGESVPVGSFVGTLWTDKLDVIGDAVEVLARYESGPLTGRPAITRRVHGPGSAAYVSTRLDPDGLTSLLGDLCAAAGLASEWPVAARGLVEVVDRGEFRFVINRGDQELVLEGFDGTLVAAPSLGGTREADGTLRLPPRAVAILRGFAPIPFAPIKD
jgi:beta-galactosidase